MIQAHTDHPPARARALFTSAAANEDSARVLGALVDLISTMRRRHTGPSGTESVLLKLAGSGPQRSCDLAGHLGLDQSTVSRHVAQLEADGLVGRSPLAQDRRAHLIELTTRGEGSAQDLIAARVAALERSLAPWPPDDVRTFGLLLERFVDGLQDEEARA
jgi:DNA-binding MarR family transcriptional regulator